MPRSRGSEMPQRQSPRVPLQLRSSSSNSDPLHNRPTSNRISKPGDRRSPRGTQSDSVNQKKLGTRISDLESQLGQAQEELKILKGQLSSAQVAKKGVQENLEKKNHKPIIPDPIKMKEEEPHHATETQESNKNDCSATFEILDDHQLETDVFEVPIEKVTVMEAQVEFKNLIEQEGDESKPFVSLSTESPTISEPEKPFPSELALKNDEINSLKSNLEQKEKEVEAFRQENESLKGQLNEATLEISSTRAKEEELNTRLSQLKNEVNESKATAVKLSKNLEATEETKESLEAEMKKLRVQTEQWRKAADAAASVLAGGVEISGKRVSDRCGSMDNKHFNGMFETPVGIGGGYNTAFGGSPGMGDDMDDGLGTGKRKGGGMKMFGDLWKRKGQK